MEYYFLRLLSIFLILSFHSQWIKSETPSRTNGIFDSFYELTDLEDFPEVCEEYSDEGCASSWLQKINEVAIRNANRMNNVDYKYMANINGKNLKLLNTFQMDFIKLSKKFEIKSRLFNWKSFRDPEIRRMFAKITPTITSRNDSISEEMVHIGNNISYIYNNAKPCFETCLKAGEGPIIELFKNERDYDKLAGFWTAWRNVTGAKIRDLFVKRMNLENQGARENGYTDAASFSLFDDFEDNNFKEVVLKIFENILPLYKELHAYVRYCLARHYPGRFDKDGPIPAHLFGNVWAQQWMNIFPIIKQCMGKIRTENFQNEADGNLAKVSVNKMFRIAEEFYESIGMYKMTDEFWERSVLEQPSGKIVDCHGSAHDFANGMDFRIMMCTKQNLEDFTVIHHEMGHVQYFMAYRDLPLLFRGSANSGFHEAIGDTIALAVKTPEHLHKIGLISKIPESTDFDIDYLMTTALEKVAFLPFALTMDTFLWNVYNGSVPISQLNKHWWDLRYKYQGLKPPVERSENDFDAGAKYHIAFGVSYIRYFISFIVQFQFYESMCNISGHTGPLHRCDFYQSKEAGSKLSEMLKQGMSKHWKETMKILTGQRDIRAESLLRFFKPLHEWLKSKNKELNISVGW